MCSQQLHGNMGPCIGWGTPPVLTWERGNPLSAGQGYTPAGMNMLKILPTVIIRMRAVILEEDRYQTVKAQSH